MTGLTVMSEASVSKTRRDFLRLLSVTVGAIAFIFVYSVTLIFPAVIGFASLHLSHEGILSKPTRFWDFRLLESAIVAHYLIIPAVIVGLFPRLRWVSLGLVLG
jgi:hypothetical protein